MHNDAGDMVEKVIVYLRDESKNPHLAYRAPLTQSMGGYETSIYHFTLRGVGDERSLH